jgi:membrane protease YdiL (CAAX protease family)
MQFPGAIGLVFLLYLLVLIPWLARKTALRLRGQLPGPPVSRLTYWKSGVIFQAILFLLAWYVGSTFDYRIFTPVELSPRSVFLAAAAFVLLLGIRAIARRSRTEEERRSLLVYSRSPRSPVEAGWFSLAVVCASVAEEAAYRGVGWAMLWWSLGNGWISAFVLCVAFALAHWNQGWKSGIVITAFAAVFHALVALTGGLVLAMLVHAAYDFLAGYQIARQARAYDAEPGVPAT